MRILGCIIGLAATPAAATITVTENGFAIENVVTAYAAPEVLWPALIEPRRYWNPQHSYSANAANFTLEVKAGGCFCETLGDGGSVEHMRVVMVLPNRQLRLVGGLGPLQQEGVAGSLTWTLKPVDGGTEVTQTYVVGGHLQADKATMAPLVGKVLGEQLTRLAALFPKQ
jgi:Activator of Hsp90 ATPase homolog 1-like protein